MKATLEYNLNETDDIKSHLRAVNSLNMAIALWDITQIKRRLQNELEFNPEYQSLNKFEIVDLMSDKIQEILTDHSINLDDLMD